MPQVVERNVGWSRMWPPPIRRQQDENNREHVERHCPDDSVDEIAGRIAARVVSDFEPDTALSDGYIVYRKNRLNLRMVESTARPI